MKLGGKFYPCSAGETFDSIALALYGNERYAAEILAENPTLCEVMVFSGGERLKLPEMDGEQSGSGYAPAAAPWKA